MIFLGSRKPSPIRSKTLATLPEPPISVRTCKKRDIISLFECPHSTLKATEILTLGLGGLNVFLVHFNLSKGLPLLL
jgi:hypothetical protein